MPHEIDLSQNKEFAAAGTQTDIPNGGATVPTPWERICRALTEDRDRLRAELETMRAERDQYRQAVFALTHETFSFDKQALLTLDPARPTLEQVISELEQTQGPHHA